MWKIALYYNILKHNSFHEMYIYSHLLYIVHYAYINTLYTKSVLQVPVSYFTCVYRYIRNYLYNHDHIRFFDHLIYILE